MTVTAVPGAAVPPRRPRVRVRPGWLPFLVALAGAATILIWYDVPAGELARFAAYTLLAGTLPGTLLWRAVRGGAGHLPLDLAFGTVTGFVVELPVYLVASERGVPLAVLAWPVVTVLAFLVVPRLRRHWRGSGLGLPAGVSWTVALGFLCVLVRGAAQGFRTSALIEPYRAAMSTDLPFQFALVGLLKHGGPLDTPWLAGNRLDYHWYVYAHGAAASRLTGIEPETLVLRLLPVPMIAAFLLVVVAVVHRVCGRWWAGALAVPLTLVGTAVSPYAWSDRPMFQGVSTENLWLSPTQTYAALLCAAAVYMLTGLLRRNSAEVRRALPWCTFAVLVGAVAGAKATFVPMLLCGLLFAVLVRLALARTVGAEAAALVITLFWFGFAQLVLFGSGSQGMVVYPLQTVKWTQLGQGVLGPPNQLGGDRPALLALTLTAVLAMAFGWAGLAGLRRRGFRRHPMVHVLVGTGLSGVGATWIFAHPGLSQTYFGRSATPYLAMVSALGLAALIPPGRRAPGWFAPLAATGALLGGAAVIWVQLTVGWQLPPGPASWTPSRAVSPYLQLTALVAGAAVLVALIGWPARLGGRYVLAAVTVTVLAAPVTTGLFGFRGLFPAITAGHQDRYSAGAAAMPAGAAEAGRWLREHSGPGEVLATNSHCRYAVAGCDSRDFWLAGYAERRVVLEGWSYTEPAFATGGLWDRTIARSRFWDQALLAANDEVFYRPTAANVAAFTRERGVRWLVAVDGTPSADPAVREPRRPSPDLDRYAVRRFRAGDITVYEVVGPPAPGGSAVCSRSAGCSPA